MTILNTWNIVAMDCSATVETMENYVVNTHWTLSGTDGTFTGSAYGTTSFEIDATKTNYISYADLTLDQVIAWTQSAMGEVQVASYEKSVADQIEAQINPTIVTLPLPWVE